MKNIAKLFDAFLGLKQPLWVCMALCMGNLVWADVQDVRLKTHDGVTLAATMYSADHKGPGVLMIHQCMDGSDRKTWHQQATDLMQKGFHVLSFDIREYGESGGTWPQISSMAEFIEVSRTVISKDVLAAFEFLKKQKHVDTDSVVVVGASCGVFMGIDLAFDHPEVKLLVLFSGPFDDTAQNKLTQLGGVPVFGVASEGDTRAYEAMKRVFKSTTHPQSINIQLKGDKHGTFMYDTMPDLIHVLSAWIARQIN